MTTRPTSCALLALLVTPCAAAQMDHAAHGGHGMDEDPVITLWLVDRLETGRMAGEAWGSWDAKLWWGTDHNRWQLRSEGHDAGTAHAGDATWEAAWLRPVSPWMQLSLGAVRDVRGTVARNGVSAGFSGVLPYRVAVQGAVWMVEGGRAALRLELEQDWLLTQRWILQPRLESRLWSNGPYSADLGLRLRYEFAREFAPYVGITRTLGHDAVKVSPTDTQVLAGLRFWF